MSIILVLTGRGKRIGVQGHPVLLDPVSNNNNIRYADRAEVTKTDLFLPPKCLSTGMYHHTVMTLYIVLIFGSMLMAYI